MSIKQENIQVVADYVCHRSLLAGEAMSVLKLHKILYYIQAWHLAIFKTEIFDSYFEAWVHGPVNPEVFKRYVDTKTMYSPVTPTDLRFVDQFSTITSHATQHIENVMGAYAHLSGPQLEELTHSEDPWITARGGLKSFERCTNTIDRNLMISFYASKLA